MSKIIVLSEDTEIDGKVYRKGELVQVDDNYDTNIKRVIDVIPDNGQPTEQVS